MASVTISEFRRHFAQSLRQAQQAPVEVRRRGQVIGYFISPADYARVAPTLLTNRRAYHPIDLPPHLQDALQQARMDPRHAPLNALLDDA